MDRPRTAIAEGERNVEGVFEKLVAGDLSVPLFEQHRERASDLSPGGPRSKAEPSEHRRPLVVADDLPRPEPGHVEIRMHVAQERADPVEAALHPEPRQPGTQLAR